MTYIVLLHPKVAKALTRLPSADKKRVKTALNRLAEDPVTPRPGADILRLSGTRGRGDLFRILIGTYRATYGVEKDEVLVTDFFIRGRGYEA